MHDDGTPGGLARQVKASREMIAALDSPGWQDLMPLPQWIGRLEAQLKLLCDEIDYLLAGTR